MSGHQNTLDIQILHPDQHDIQIINPAMKAHDHTKLSMSLDQIKTQEDVEIWREHNVEVASYLATIVRNELLDVGTETRDMFIDGDNPIPQVIRDAMTLWDSINNERKGETVHLKLDENPEDENLLNIKVFDENHPRVKILNSLLRDEEIATDIVQWVGDYLGVPTIIYYTAPDALTTGIGGHAQALVRTPYQDISGTWLYDVMDPMQLKPIIGLPLQAQSRDEAFEELGSRMYCNTIGSHLLENKVDLNLLEKLSGFDAYDLILHSGSAKPQEKDYVNCQFMCLLLQAYLCSYYGSLKDVTAGTIPNVNLGDVINKRFQEVFNVSIKQVFDVMNSVEPFEVKVN